jgi:hypothetical protein
MDIDLGTQSFNFEFPCSLALCDRKTLWSLLALSIGGQVREKASADGSEGDIESYINLFILKVLFALLCLFAMLTFFDQPIELRAPLMLLVVILLRNTGSGT